MNLKIKVLDNFETHHDTLFKRCYAQMYQAVVDKAGYVFPCPQTALKNYEHLCYANIGEDSILKILNSKKRESFYSLNVEKDMKCHICDRKDSAINKKLNKLLLN